MWEAYLVLCGNLCLRNIFKSLILGCVCYRDMTKNPVVEVRKDAFASLEKLKNL